MNGSKENDIDVFIQKISDKEATLKDKKYALTRIYDIIKDVNNCENICTSWEQILDNACWAIFMKTERNDIRNAASKVISAIGFVLFDSCEFEKFMIYIMGLFENTQKKGEDERVELIYCIGQIVELIKLSSFELNNIKYQNVEKCLEFFLNLIPTSSNQTYVQIIKGINIIANGFPNIFEKSFETTINVLCTNISNKTSKESQFQLLLNTLESFQYFFLLKTCLVESLTELIISNDYLTSEQFFKFADLKKRFKVLVVLLKTSNNEHLFKDILDKINYIIGISKGRYSTISFIDIIIEMCKIGKENKNLTKIMDESIEKLLLNLTVLSKSVKENQTIIFFFVKIWKYVSTSSNMKNQMIDIVFGDKFGFFTNRNQMEYIIGNSQLYLGVSQLVSFFLTTTSLANLQKTYSFLIKIVIESVEALKSTETNLSGNMKRWHEARLLILLTSLKTISCEKSSLIVILGIRPPIFEFLNNEMPLKDSLFAKNHHHVYHLLVHILVLHLKAHDYYLPQSGYIIKEEDSSFGQEKREYTKQQIQSINNILKFEEDVLSKETKLLISSWICSLIESALNKNIGSTEFSTSEWVTLYYCLSQQSSLFWNNEKIRSAFLNLAKVMKCEVDNGNVVFEKTKKMTWKDAAAVWEAGDSKIYMRQSVSVGYQMAQEQQQSEIPATSFGAEEFMIVTNFLLSSKVPTTFKKGCYVWMDNVLEIMTNSCKSCEKKEIIVSEEFLEKWRWVLNQTAVFCIVNKMKTPLGKPMETLNSFSAVLNRMAKDILTNRRADDEKYSKKTDDDGRFRYTIQWLRVRLLIEFVDILDKLMYNTMSGGSSFNLFEVSNLSRAFFTTNAQSCNEWFHRTYYSALVIAFFNGNYPLVVRFGWGALLNFQKRAKDEKSTNTVVMIACWMCRAMAALSAPQAVIGLKTWVKTEFKTEMAQNLMDALEMLADSRYEASLEMFENILNCDEKITDTFKIIIHNSMIDILNRLRLPEAIDYYKNVLYQNEENVSEDFKSVEMLTKFEKVENKQKRNTTSWNIKQKCLEIESAFCQTMRKSEINEIRNDVSAMGSLLLMTDASCRIYSDISSTNLVISLLVDKMNNVRTKNELTTRQLFGNGENFDKGEQLSMCRKIMHWGRHLKNSRGNSVEANVEIIRLARKTNNRQLAICHINSATKGEELKPWMRLEIERQAFKLTKNDPFEIQIQEMNELFSNLTDVFVSTYQIKQSVMIDNSQGIKMYNELKKRDEHMSRTCIQLADFFEKSPESVKMLSPNFVSSFFWAELTRRLVQLEPGYRGLVGSLLCLSAEMFPELSKAHLKFAQWAYETAKSENVSSGSLPYRINFEPYQNIEQVEENQLQKCFDVSTSGQFEKEIGKVVKDQKKLLNILNPNSIYMKKWKIIREHRNKYLSLSATSYFAFIQSMAGAYSYSKKEETTVATLRILDMLVRYGDVLGYLIEDGLATTSEHVWKEILPQLFARLSHPSEHIRNTIVNLIARICKAAPHAVVFQVVSGTASTNVTGNVEGIEEDQQINSEDDRNKVRDCCEILENKLAESYPNLVKDVKLFVSELEKINLLNEEKWALVLGTMEHEMERRLAFIRLENAKTAASTFLSAETKTKIIEEKTKLMSSQIFDILDELYDRTCLKEASTSNEKSFQATFRDSLSAAFTESKLHRLQPEKAWAPFKNIIPMIVHRNSKRGMQSFETQNISPYLASLSGSCVPMPGQDEVEFDKVITIGKVWKHVTVLPTKTRPKKLSFYGSDGKSNTFLFKGREDLHLDERVMQFLRLCNVMLSNETSLEYQAHNYAVIPFGPRSGLIKWVEGATPLFHIYRKWQIRDKTLRQANKKNEETVSDIEKPSEMFNRAARQAIAAHNLEASVIADRSKWPSSVYSSIYKSLIQKTPNDLLSREMRIRSGCATTWWRKSLRFARSCAVMSMIGSVLGLGDRHLDNVLVDLNRGHVVHIDYNICFDKGKNLRIPETVPFRMTQNMVAALGPGNNHGVFRESCVHVLSVLRNGKQVLRMLLDAFVYDPLVDWANHEHGTSSGIMLALQLAVYGTEWKLKAKENSKGVFEMLKLKVTELTFEWLKNRDELKNVLTSILKFPNAENVQEVEVEGLLKNAITKHYEIMKEFRVLLRKLSRDHANIAEYYHLYKTCFSDPLLKGNDTFLNDKTNIDGFIKCFETVLNNLDIVYEAIVSLVSNKDNQKILKPFGANNVWVAEQDQDENAMARMVVRNVEKRLDGFLETKQQIMCSPAEQADSLIDEALSVTNLSMMYEGWTSWV